MRTARVLKSVLLGTVALALAAQPGFADGGAGGDSGGGATGGAGGASNDTSAGGAGVLGTASTGYGGGGGGGAGTTGGGGGGAIFAGATPGANGSYGGGGGGGYHGYAGGGSLLTLTGGNGGDGGNGSGSATGSGGGGGGAAGYGAVHTGTSASVGSLVTIAGGDGGDGGDGGTGSSGGGGEGGGGGDGGIGLVTTQSSADVTISGSVRGGDGGNGGAGAAGATTSGDAGNGGDGGAGFSARQSVDLEIVSGASVSGGDGGIGGNGVTGAAAGDGGDGGAGLFFGASASVTVSGTVSGGRGSNAGTPTSGGTSGSNGAGGAGIQGSDLTVTMKDGAFVTGGFDGSNSVRADAIEFTSGTNRLTLESGYIITGNVSADGTSDTLALGGATDASFDISAIGSLGKFHDFEAFEKTGSGTWTLTSSTTESTPWTVTEGTLSIIGSGALSAGSSVTLNGGTLAIRSNGTTSNSFSVGASNGTLDVDGTVRVTLNGTFSGSGALTKSGTGTVILAADNSGFSGSTTVSAGTLTLRNALGSGDISIGASGTLELDQSSNSTFSNAFSGTGAMTKTGSGMSTLSGDSSSYTGTATISTGTLSLRGAFGGDVAVGSGTTLRFDQSIDRSFGGDMTGTGALAKLGAATTTLTGDLSGYSGSTTIAGGTLRVEGGFGGDVAIVTAGAFELAQTSDRTLPAVFTGSGALSKTGSGSTTLSGTSSAFSGTTTVSGGSLLVTGQLGGVTSSMQVASGGTLGGTGTLGGDVTVASGGTMSPGLSPGTLTINGDIVFGAGSTYRVETVAGGTTSDLISVGGTATLGGTVAHIGPNGDYESGASYTILTAGGGIIDTFDGVTSSLSFLDPSLSYSATDVTLTLERNDTGFADVASTANQRATAAAYQGLGAGNAVYDALVRLDAASAQDAYDALSGEIHASVQSGLVEDSGVARGVLTSRIRRAFSAVSSGGAGTVSYGAHGDLSAPEPAISSVATWGEGFGSWGSTGGNGNTAGVDRETAGVLAGVEAQIGTSGMAGLMAGYQSSTYESSSRASSAEAQTYHLGAYGGMALGSVSLRGGAVYSWSDVDTSRQVVFTGFSESLNGSTRGGTVQIFGEAGYGLLKDGPVTLEPFAGLAYVAARTDGYTETGGAAALTVASNTTEATYTTLGLQAGADLPVDFARLHASGLVGWQHAFGTLDPVTTNGVTGAGLTEDVAVVGAGLTLDLGSVSDLGMSRASLSVDYDGRFGDDAIDNSVTGRFRLTF